MANARAAKKAAKAKEAQTKTVEVKAAEAATEVMAEETQTVEAKETEVKTDAPVAEVKEADKTEVKAEAKAEEVKPVKKVGRPKKTAVAAKEAPKAEKKAKEVKNAAAKTEATGVNVVVEFNGTQRKVDEIVDKIKNEWVAAGHRLSSIKSLDVYIKPEDYTAYYVINGKVTGKVWM